MAVTACQQNKAPANLPILLLTIQILSIRVHQIGYRASRPAGQKANTIGTTGSAGVSIGQTTINESGENVHKRLGTPDGGDAAMGKSVSIWYANHDTTGYVTQMYFSRGQGNDEIKRVKQIRVTSPFFKINNEVHTGCR
jgi:hypothetical protein